jgi:hypothetical protein
MEFFKNKLPTIEQKDDSDDLICHIDHSWSDDNGFYLKGWILHKHESLDTVQIIFGDNVIPITTWYNRPDVLKNIQVLISKFPNYSKIEKCGFSIYIPHKRENTIIINAKAGNQNIQKQVNFSNTKKPISYIDGSNIFIEFIKRVNDEHLTVLEIGSRIVSSGGSSLRHHFPDAKSYTGFDIYSDSNTDVVGDAHKLSQYFKGQKFDAVFSIAVFEHLAMPWVVAKEINKVLEIGGITFHISHFSWPIHETPWDFFRYSDEGFKALFPPTMGYKIIKAGLFSPLSMYFDTMTPGQEELPLQTGFGGVAILAEKKSDVDCEKFCWDTTVEEVLGNASHYPKPK